MVRHENAIVPFMTSAKPSASVGAPLAGTTLTFVNELGSTAEFTFAQGGGISGTYTSKVSGGGGTVSGPITGWFNGYVLAWSVAWSTATPAVTSWTGALVADGGVNVIDALWYLSTQTSNPGDPSQFWGAINAGADTFTQQ